MLRSACLGSIQLHEVYHEVFTITARIAIRTGRRKSIITACQIDKADIRSCCGIKVTSRVFARRGARHQIFTENKRRRVVGESSRTHIPPITINAIRILYRQVISTNVASGLFTVKRVGVTALETGIVVESHVVETIKLQERAADVVSEIVAYIETSAAYRG